MGLLRGGTDRGRARPESPQGARGPRRRAPLHQHGPRRGIQVDGPAGMTTSLRSRLLASHLVVAAVGACALVIVSATVTNVAFRVRLHDRMGMMGGPPAAGKAADAHQLQSALSESLAWALKFGVLAAFITAGVAAVIVARRISEPVVQIRAATHRMARGEF